MSVIGLFTVNLPVKKLEENDIHYSSVPYSQVQIFFILDLTYVGSQLFLQDLYPPDPKWTWIQDQRLEQSSKKLSGLKYPK